ncbi:MAG: aerotolerance regulator BatB, partial [Candidatus Methylomirabilis sp.]|nr:aerotolerance regulator BatB [Deltaproteobacteria bacterium]
MRFAASQYLALLWLAPALALLFAHGRRRRAAILRALGHAPTVARMAAEASPAKRVMGAALFVAAFALASFALARPQFGLRSELRPSRGVDVVVAVDVSKSMMAADVPPSRLRKAKVELRALL